LSNSTSKRLRVFAGPNGSGKSTLAGALGQSGNAHIKLGIFVNADNIERVLKSSNQLDFNQFKINVTTAQVRAYILSSGMSPGLLKEADIERRFSVERNVLHFHGSLNSYIAADIAGFLRHRLAEEGISYSFESVFSHFSKLDVIRRAKELGYRVYLYFITTEHPDINVSKVKIRVELGGHPVPEDKIRERYYRSMDLLYEAIKLSDRAYLFDYSGEYYEMVAEITDGKYVQVLDDDGRLPNWFVKYVYEKMRP
jgi:predicted ABC-type ATPase